MSSQQRQTPETASQTAGPYVHIGCTPNFSGIANLYKEDLGSNLILGDVEGEQITIKGKIFDGNNEPLLDAMVEIWQADSNGFYNSHQKQRDKTTPNFTGWGRCPSDLITGEFTFKTIKPGQVLQSETQLQAPHITFWIVARGINIGLHTRLYFDNEQEANASDPLLSTVKDKPRISTLLAKQNDAGIYQFDIHLQGEQETIFLDL